MFPAIAAIAVGLAVLAPPLPDPPLSAQTIVARMLEHTAANERLKQEHFVTFEKVQVTRDLTRTPPQEESEISLQYYRGGQLYERLADKEKPSILFSDYISPARYAFRPADPPLVSIDERTYYAMDFTPTGKVKAHSDQEDMINRLSGTAYIDTQTYLIMCLQGHLAKPFGKGPFGLLAKISQFDATVTQKVVDGIVVSDQTSHTVRYSVPIVGETYEEEINTYQNYQPIPTVAPPP